MKISNLKQDLIKKILQINDDVLLIKFSDILNKKNDLETEINVSSGHEPELKYENVRVFSAEEKRRINIALKQVENGEYISDKEAKIEIEKWFAEQEK